MDYSELAAELLRSMHALRRFKPQRNINEAIQGETFVLGYIVHHGGEVLPGDISQEMDVSSARIAAALNSLEKKGLVTRQIDTNDRRKIIVGITQEGRNLAGKHNQAALGVAVKMLECLGEHDAREYVRIMKKLAESLPDRNEITE